jgi:(4-(4-[2-(gamma-L-glutamylamino)ethyl]phenoxymethyl)furan-2-yl)methanamine synthase
MAVYLGWDIGGVHLKLSRLDIDEDGSARLRTQVVPFEIWKDAGGLSARLRAMLEVTGRRRGGRAAVAVHGVTMTAELSDIFPTRRDGVRAILSACSEAFSGSEQISDAPFAVLDLEGRFVELADAMERPLRVAAANWIATACAVAHAVGADGAALLIDIGSTTTDIVPVRGGRPRPQGRTDTERLQSGELVYTGLLRTPPAAFAETVPLAGSSCRLSPEHFTITADVYRVLGRIGEEEYTVQTPDGRGKNREASAARLARLVCSDAETLGTPVIEAIAAHLEDRQVDQITGAVRQVLMRELQGATHSGVTPPAVVAGAGAFLAAAAAERAGLHATRLSRLFPAIMGDRWDVAAPSASIAILLALDAGERILPVWPPS